MGVFRLLTQNANLQTDDLDMSFEAFAQGVPRDFPLQDPAGIVPNDGVISKIVVGWKARDPSATPSDTMRAGLRSAGVRQFGASLLLDAGSYLPIQEDEFTVDASDGLPWTFAKLQAMALADSGFTAIADSVTGTPDPRITFAYADVHAVTPPDVHHSAQPSSTSPGGAPTSSSPSGAPTSSTPKGAPS